MGEFLYQVGLVAPLVTKAVDLVRNLLDPSAVRPKATWNVVAFAFGVGYALITATNYALLVTAVRPEVQSVLQGVGGQILTGLAIGAVASGWHELFSAVSSVQSKNEA